MGKNLIVKGANFSENGFHVNVTKTTLTTLYYKDGTAYDGNSVVSGTTNTIYHTFVTDGAALVEGTALAMSFTNKIDLSNYPNAVCVNVQTVVQVGYISSSVAGLIILAFLDENNNLISGYCTSEDAAQIGSNLNLTPLGPSNDVRELENIVIPSNTRYILAPWNSSKTNKRSADVYKVVIIEESDDQL